MKTLKAFFAVGLFLVGLSFTSCSSDDDIIEPVQPEHPIWKPDETPEHPIWKPEGVQPLP